MSIKKLFDYSQPIVAAATVIVIGGLLAVIWGGNVLYKIRTADEAIETTGSAKEEVMADYTRWSLNLEARVGVNEQQRGFLLVEGATQKITDYVNGAGFEDVEALVIRSYPNYNYPQYGEPVMTGYTVSREIVIRSEKVDELTALANDISALSGSGYTVSTNMLEYTYSKLDEMRIKLLSQAIQDAKARADAIASESGRKIGAIKSASSGVVQVMSKGNLNISDYGYYDTQSRHKEVMVTVRATFKLR